jgi:hypothetical protein
MQSVAFGEKNSGVQVAINQGSIYVSQGQPDLRPHIMVLMQGGLEMADSPSIEYRIPTRASARSCVDRTIPTRSSYRQGRIDEAKSLQLYAMQTLKTNLGEQHPHTSTVMGDMALIYKEQH